MDKIIFHPEFVTATIYEWHALLKKDEFKQIIIDSLKFLVKEDRIILYAYCLMDTHIHLIWQVKGKWLSSQVRRDFFKYTAQQFKKLLEQKYPRALHIFKSTQQDRLYQFWERHTLCVELFTPVVFDQKVDYIHNNPVKAGLCRYPEEYVYSSAKYYLNAVDEFNFLSHYNG